MLDTKSPPKSKKSELCPKCGIYHCRVCDICLSGHEPHIQHEASVKHKKKVHDQALMEEAKAAKSTLQKVTSPKLSLFNVTTGKEAVRNTDNSAARSSPSSAEMISSSTFAPSVTPQHSSELHLPSSNLSVTTVVQLPEKEDSEENNWREYVNPNCSLPGCTDHCIVCDRHLVGSTIVSCHFQSQEHKDALNVFLASKEIEAAKVNPSPQGSVTSIDPTRHLNLLGTSLVTTTPHCPPASANFTTDGSGVVGQNIVPVTKKGAIGDVEKDLVGKDQIDGLVVKKKDGSVLDIHGVKGACIIK